MDTKNKITAILLAVIMVCSMMAFVLPAMAGQGGSSDNSARQYAVITKSIEAVKIMNQAGTEDVSSWTFTGMAGETDTDPENSENETQAITTADKPIATLKNTADQNMKVYLEFGSWTGGNKVGAEYYNITDRGTSAGVFTEATYDTSIDIGTIDSGTMKNMWLKLELLKTGGNPESTFTVESEVA